MNQACVEHLFSKLKFPLGRKPRKLRNQEGPEGRIRKLQKTVTALIKYERLELNYSRGDEARGYVELLLSQAVRNGPTDEETMNMAKFWVQDKQLISKLFNVLVPRYEKYPLAFTNLHRVPTEYIGKQRPYTRGVLELSGHPYPELGKITIHKDNMLHNQLLAAARQATKEKA